MSGLAKRYVTQYHPLQKSMVIPWLSEWAKPARVGQRGLSVILGSAFASEPSTQHKCPAVGMAGAAVSNVFRDLEMTSEILVTDNG